MIGIVYMWFLSCDTLCAYFSKQYEIHNFSGVVSPSGKHLWPPPLFFVTCRFKGTDEWVDGQLSMLYISISFAHLSFFVCIIWSNHFGEMTGDLEMVEVNSSLCFIRHHTMSM